jgi:hypothetical protein
MLLPVICHDALADRPASEGRPHSPVRELPSSTSALRALVAMAVMLPASATLVARHRTSLGVDGCEAVYDMPPLLIKAAGALPWPIS